MKDRVFLDTNLIFYLYSEDEHDKQSIILDLLPKYLNIISTQVINELSNILFKKMKFTWADIEDVTEELIQNFEVRIIDINIIKTAYFLAGKYNYNYFDSLMLASALENNCKVIYSEDMHHRQIIEEKLQILNPFIP
ncbi:MAG TPA: PIN domain-containing protein [Candidatus Eremiobacteraeota bacterium]|nr:MAG: PIN domain protein [bacterium ADurb.Bin363]HPZ09955.1 PIN domain-containing protein [Candidatus Eremiobacteraeota bacterium]